MAIVGVLCQHIIGRDSEIAPAECQKRIQR